MNFSDIPLDPSILKLPSIEPLAAQWQRHLAEKADRILIRRVEEIEGRVPSNDEIRTFGHCALHCDGRTEWKWRGVTILVIMPPRTAENGSILVDFMT